MATTYTVSVNGMIGNVVFYKRKGKELARARPRKYKQTKGTKAQADIFGQASRTASLLWQMLKPWAAGAADGDTWSRLNKVVAEWLRTNPLADTNLQNNLPFIEGFCFSEQTALAERLKIPLPVNRTATGMLQLALPALTPTLQIVAPAYTKSVTCKIIACSCSMGDLPALANVVNEINIPYTSDLLPAHQVLLPIATNAGQVTLVAIALQYHTATKSKTGTATDPRWHPAGIVAAFYN